MYVCMLNNSFGMLDEILEVRNMSGNIKEIGVDYSSMNKNIKIPFKMFVPPKKKIEFRMKDHMSQYSALHMGPLYRRIKNSSWRCHHYGRYGHIRPYCYNIDGYSQSFNQPRVNKKGGKNN